MPEQPKREVEILNGALALGLDERDEYLDKACAGDDVLRKQIDTLIDAHDQAGNFLDDPPTALESRKTSTRTVLLTEKPGDKIGRYKLLQQIGEGGCGVVYMAEQEDPVRRRVALKVIKLGMDTKSVIARFEAERQALALMDHPNIARVLDADATETGRPYFVMELVRGIKITDYCDENKVSTEDRLKLFIQVCHAMQHAHQKGIIHRDIKPSNILVTINDGVPVPKVIDFGIAKATAGRLTDKTLFTAFEQFIGTPAYMSPEQAAMTSVDIDTRSDIYSLGVLLYELLTGKTPFDADELMRAGLDTMRRTILEQEPLKPSTRLSSMFDADRTDVANRRQTDPPKLIHLVRGDLDWIVMKSLEKERDRRYETATGLAADLQQHLNNEPVSASPPSQFYRLQKAVRRNKGGFAALTVIALVLVIGVIVSASQTVRAKRAEVEQKRLRKQAETAAAKSEHTAQFLKDMLKGAGPSIARGRDATVLREILDSTAERVGKDLTNQPDIQGELWFTLGRTYLDIGDNDSAVTMFKKACECFRHGSVEPSKRSASALINLAEAQSATGNAAEGRVNGRLAIEIARRCGDPETLAQCLVTMPLCLNNYGQVNSEGEPFLREAMPMCQNLVKNPQLLSTCLGHLAIVTTNSEEGEWLTRESLKLDQQTLGTDHPRIAAGLFRLGEILLDRNKLAEAESILRDAADHYQRFYDKKHFYQQVTARYLQEALVRQGKWDEAELVLRQEFEKTSSKEMYWMTLVRLKAARGDWPAALEQVSRAHDAKVDSPYLSLNQTVLFLRMERLEEYRALCNDLLSHEMDWKDKAHIAKAALVLPITGPGFERACELADSTVALPHLLNFKPDADVTVALAHLRREHFAQANELASHIASDCDSPKRIQVQAWFVRTIAEIHLGQIDLAKATFAKGDELFKLPHVDFVGNMYCGGWGDWTIAELLRREAAANLDGQGRSAIPVNRQKSP